MKFQFILYEIFIYFYEMSLDSVIVGSDSQDKKPNLIAFCWLE